MPPPAQRHGGTYAVLLILSVVCLAAIGISVFRINQKKPPSLAFSASALEIVRGQSCFVRWYATHTDSLRLNGELVPNSGSRAVFPAATTTYRLVASGPGGKSESREVTVRVIEPAVAPTIQFAGNRDRITAGQSVTLRWSVTGATRIQVDPALGLGSVAAEEQRAVTPQHTTEYTLTAEGPGGTAVSHFKVWVDLPRQPAVGNEGTSSQPSSTPPPRPAIIAFEAAPADSIQQCQVVVLRWTVRDAASASIQPEIGSVGPEAGYKVLRLLHTTRYVLRVDGPGGQAARDVTISVAPGNRSSCEP